MPAIASISVKYGRKYQLRKDDWVNLEALVTLTVNSEEADLTDPHEVAAEAFGIARQAVREQGQALRKQLEELEQRRKEDEAARQGNGTRRGPRQ